MKTFEDSKRRRQERLRREWDREARWDCLCRKVLDTVMTALLIAVMAAVMWFAVAVENDQVGADIDLQAHFQGSAYVMADLGELLSR